MIEEKYLVFGGRELGVFIVILTSTIPVMAKLELNREIAYIVIFVIILLMIFIYCNFMLLFNESYHFFKRKIQKNKHKENDTTLDFERDSDINKNRVEIDQDVNIIRERKMQDEKNKFEQLQDVAKQYIIDTFSLYCSNEDIQNLLTAVIDFSNGIKDFSNHKSINPKVLSKVDLRHFGWNIWNHFKVGNQDEIALFLKSIFMEKLANLEVESIKSHLKDDEKKGIIKIKKNYL